MQENTFKIALFQENDLVCERGFDADVFSPSVKSPVDIRNILPSIISRLQRGLSKREYYTEFEANNELVYDMYEYRNEMIESYPKKYQSSMNITPQIKKQVIESKTISGVEFKFSFFVNENLIVERVFYVNGYNEEVKYSMDLYFMINDISNQIFSFLKKCDIGHIWDDYDLINSYNMTIQQIRELPSNKRNDLLRKLR
jgi:hypothetical protein